jgi:hypothetical protein
MSQGLLSLGLNVKVTADKRASGDIHIIQGPWYAYREWFGKKNVLMLDRCFYGRTQEWCTVGWLRPDASRDFMTQGKNGDRWGRHSAELGIQLEPLARGSIDVLFGDHAIDATKYRQIFDELRTRGGDAAYRPHPSAPEWPDCPVREASERLDTVLLDTRTAIGFHTSTLVTAALQGVPVVCFDYRNPVYEIAGHKIGEDGMTDRRAWVYRLAWSQWHLDELRDGTFWKHLGVNYA